MHEPGLSHPSAHQCLFGCSPECRASSLGNENENQEEVRVAKDQLQSKHDTENVVEWVGETCTDIYVCV